METLKKVRLKKDAERRFRSGHPWIFSNELQNWDAKTVQPGDWVEVATASGEWAAYGYGNPHSLIAVRVVSRNADLDPRSSSFWTQRLVSAEQFRHSMGLGGVSHRVFFGEADGIPGLVIDRFRTDGPSTWVIQLHTAGVEKNLEPLAEALAELFQTNPLFQDKESKADPVLVIRRDLSYRDREGLKEEPTQTIGELPEHLRWDQLPIQLASGVEGRTTTLLADLAGGQKTGFFLDQRENIRAFQRLLRQRLLSGQGWGASKDRKKMADLFCYVGQWSVAAKEVFEAVDSDQKVKQWDFDFFDASKTALALAEKNIHLGPAGKSAPAKMGFQTFQAKAFIGDLFETFGATEGAAVKAAVPAEAQWDLAVLDPPALITGKKNLETGKHAYLKLNTETLKRIRSGGWIVTCSCSGLLTEEDFGLMLSKAERRAGKSVRWFYRGGPALDHPLSSAFTEGRYLKCWIGEVV